MNGEIEVLRTETVIFQIKPHDEQATEAKLRQIEETIVTEVRVGETQTRFTRLKKSLRKRSKSIL